LFRSLNWKGPGKYRLHVHLMAGDVTCEIEAGGVQFRLGESWLTRKIFIL
jgi:hypothetical protein